MQCSTAFYDYLVNCPDGIIVNLQANVGPYSALQWQITDKFGNQYTGDVLTNGSGGFNIPVSDLPEGLLNSYSGNFELKVLDVDNQCRPVPILVAGYYDSIEFRVRRGTKIKSNLGCYVECQEAGTIQFFTGDGVETVFTLNTTPSNEEVYVGGLLYQAGVNYNISGNELVFTDPPSEDVQIRINY